MGTAAVLVTGVAGVASAATSSAAVNFEIQSLDGSGNNKAHPTWGQSNLPYLRVAPANYKDGKGAPQTGPNSRFVSNRVFNDVGQNVFSERSVTQWVWTWGQFIDHNIGLAQGGGATANIPFNANDGVERFSDSLGFLAFQRDAASPGTGTSTTNPREQNNTVNAFIDADAVYGGNATRDEWLRDGPVDDNLANNAATLMLPDQYLPRRDARGNASTAPDVAIDGRLIAQPTRAAVAGDFRVNENIALTGTHTLFAREHNRIVGMLPDILTAEQKFQIARRVVISEIQFITYNEFLPALGLNLPAYRGYNPNVNATISNEFATVGYRAHSQIHGEIEVDADRDRYTQAQLDAFAAAGVKVEAGEKPDELVLAVPLNVAFFNPDLLQQIGEGPVMQAMGAEVQYKNDALIDNELRSVLFQVPKPGSTSCLEPVDPACYTTLQDLGALDIERGRDHGMPSYNALRVAYGLAPKANFTAVVGSGSPETFPADPKLTPGNEINQLASLDITGLTDVNGQPIALDDPRATTDAVSIKRRTPLAARLKAIYGTVDKLDAFTGMMSEQHLPGSEFGELQAAIWKKQFLALRDGDRFFFGNQTDNLNLINGTFGIDFHTTLSQLIARNTDIPADELAANVFVKDSAPAVASKASRTMSLGTNPASGIDRVDARREQQN